VFVCKHAIKAFLTYIIKEINVIMNFSYSYIEIMFDNLFSNVYQLFGQYPMIIFIGMKSIFYIYLLDVYRNNSMVIQ
jgi:hypothetical protein